MKLMPCVMLLSLFFASLAPAAEKGGKPPSYDSSITQTQMLDIAEATFRHQFTHNASGQQQKSSAYCLTLFGKDPDAGFLARFKDHKPPVQKGSEFVEGKGLKFHISKIKRISASKVEVSGGYYEGGLSSSGNTYLLELKDGKWIVAEDKMLWIS